MYKRQDQTAPQLLEPHSFRLTALQHGIQRMLWGYFKKMVIADRAAVLVDQVFGSYDTYPGSVLAVGVLFYSLQQYADFSGGIDVVLGAAELFGIRLPENFTRPYFSHSLSEMCIRDRPGAARRPPAWGCPAKSRRRPQWRPWPRRCRR